MSNTVMTLADVDRIVTDAVVAEYWERGYWISPPLFDDAEIERLRAAHERLWAGEYDFHTPSQYGIAPVTHGSNALRQQCNAFWLNAAIREAVLSPLLGAIAARLMRVDSVRLWHDQAIYKPGTGEGPTTDAGNVGWHQDYGFWTSASTTNMCTAWVALQDTDLHNGGMRTIVGSHKWGLVEGSDSFFDQDLEALAQKFAAQGGSPWLDEPCILKAGQASFHHALTFHGSGPNRSSEPRLSVVSHLMPGDTTFRAGRPWHPNNTLLGPNAYDGQPYSGDFWPQLWPVVSR
ncbi:MAG: phytanoyl-CoA dioxygenase family protein [Chloroflexaceae bacterium]|jgi:ectoine hydroxylase-related dioxygenase (phytanoyl-CoA dioxygenase family)|nr:phytanoyl-CoA dioxygenase family protein [Chloroflexaceae bacterium]